MWLSCLSTRQLTDHVSGLRCLLISAILFLQERTNHHHSSKFFVEFAPDREKKVKEVLEKWRWIVLYLKIKVRCNVAVRDMRFGSLAVVMFNMLCTGIGILFLTYHSLSCILQKITASDYCFTSYSNVLVEIWFQGEICEHSEMLDFKLNMTF